MEMEPEVKKSDSEASGEEEQEEESTEKHTQEAKVRPWSFNIHVLCTAAPSGRSPIFICLFVVFLQEQESKSIKLEDLLEKEARAFSFGDRSQMGRPVRQSTAGPCTRRGHVVPSHLHRDHRLDQVPSQALESPREPQRALSSWPNARAS